MGLLSFFRRTVINEFYHSVTFLLKYNKLQICLRDRKIRCNKRMIVACDVEESTITDNEDLFADSQMKC